MEQEKVKYYLWIDGKLVIMTSKININIPLHSASYVVECKYENSDVGRYGKFNGMYWQDATFASLPKEFKAHLLLLGIS